MERTTGIKLTGSSIRRKAQKAVNSRNYLILIIFVLIIIASMIFVGCSSKSKAELNKYYTQAVSAFEESCNMSEQDAKKAVEIIDNCNILSGEIKIRDFYDNCYTLQLLSGSYEMYLLTTENNELTNVRTFVGDNMLYSSGTYYTIDENTTAIANSDKTNSEKSTEVPTTEEPTTEKVTDLPTEENDYELIITDWTNTVEAGSEASVTIQGKPNTKYNIVVYYHSGASDAEGLEPKISDDNGNVTWTWKVGSRTEKDTYNIKINGDGKHAEIQFTVV